MRLLSRLIARFQRTHAAPAPAVAQDQGDKLLTPMSMKIHHGAVDAARGAAVLTVRPSPFQPARPMPGVAPQGEDIAIAMDSAGDWAMLSSTMSEGLSFMGYPYLSELTQRPEYRRPSEILANEMTRKWIRFQATGDTDKSDKLAAIEAEFKRLNVQDVFRQAAEHDGFFGRAQIYIDTGDTGDADELKFPLSASKYKIRRGGIKRLKVIEPMWTYPDAYNSSDPLRDDFYRPTSWFVFGKRVHASRMLTMVSREVPDILKPAYAFGGLSLSQMAKPYIDNWLRTRQSVSDAISNFSTTVLQTNMGAVLNGGAANDMLARARLFTTVKANNGLMILDKDAEDLKNVSMPLSGLDHLQAQAQEHMSAVTGIPLVVLLGITPSGLNASSEGELQTFYAWIESQQEAQFTGHLSKLLNLVQLSLFGEIDPAIGFKFNPLRVLSDKEQADVRKTEMDTDAAGIQAGILDPHEARVRLASDEDGPYASLDLEIDPQPPEQGPDGGGSPFGGGAPDGLDADDPGGNAGSPGANAGDEFAAPKPTSKPPTMAGDAAEWRESDHKRADNGQFGSGAFQAKAAHAGSLSAAAKTPEHHEAAALAHYDAGLAAHHDESVAKHHAKVADSHKDLASKLRADAEANPQDDHEIERALANKLGMKQIGRTAKGGNEYGSSDPAAFEAGVAEYSKLKDADGGKILNTDTARELSEHYMKDRTKSAAVHEPASRFIKDLYAKKLAETPGPGQQNLVLFTAGGTGAGKSTAVQNLPALADLGSQAQMIYDTNMNGYESSKSKIEQALAAGKNVAITLVARDPEDALVNGALPRAENQRKKFGTGRTVPLKEHIGTHIGAIDTIKKLSKEYAGDPRVHISVVDNSHGKGKAQQRDLDWLHSLQYNDIEGRVTRALEKEHEAGRISRETYEGFAGKPRHAQDARPRRNGLVRSSEEEHRADDGGSSEQGRSEGRVGEEVARRDGAGEAHPRNLAADAEFKEGDHPRASNGQFGSAASAEAHAASKSAKTAGDHEEAALSHWRAAQGHRDRGNTKAADSHESEGDHHRKQAQHLRKNPKDGAKLAHYTLSAAEAHEQSSAARTAEEHEEAALSHWRAQQQAGDHEHLSARAEHHRAAGDAHRSKAQAIRRGIMAGDSGLPIALDAALVLRKLAGIAQDDEHWITLNGGGGKGTPALINAHGVVIGGAGGKMNGVKLDPKSKSAGRADSDTGHHKAASALQNRNRNSAASIAQMTKIAAHPNPRLLMAAPTMNDGAPVVTDLGRKGIAKLMGKRDHMVTGKREVAFRYAVVEASDLHASNNADGTKNDDYATNHDKLTAINNGRTAGLQAAYKNGNADDYKKAIARAEGVHGISGSAIRKMKAPVLVRVMDAGDVGDDIGDESNSTHTLSLSATEQAQNDAKRFDPSAIDYNDDGTPSDASVKGFINAMPESERQSLAPNGQPTRQAIERMTAATFHAAYGDHELVSLMAQATDPESKNLIGGMSKAAGAMAKLKDAGDLDIRSVVTGAAKQVINAVRSGVGVKKFLTQGDLLTSSAEDALATMFAQNARSAKAIGERLAHMASFAFEQSQRGGVDMFGEQIPTASRHDVLEKAREYES